MTAGELWNRFCAERGVPDGDYEAWAFGDDADALAALVLSGAKTGTSSAHALYAIDGEALPQAGEYSVILDSRDRAVCVIRTDRVYVTAFEDVSAEHARREGEGDLSLDYWRQVHERFFTAELAGAGLAFDPRMQVVCEEFSVVCRP